MTRPHTTAEGTLHGMLSRWCALPLVLIPAIGILPDYRGFFPTLLVLSAGAIALGLRPRASDSASSGALVLLYLLIPGYVLIQAIILGNYDSLSPFPDQYQRSRAGSYLGFVSGALILATPATFRRVEPYLLLVLPMSGIASGLWAAWALLVENEVRFGGATNAVSFGYLCGFNLLLTALLWRKQRMPARLAAAYSVLGGLGFALAVVASGTRGAWLGLALAGSFILWRRHRGAPYKLAAALALLSLVILASLQAPQVRGRIDEAISDLDSYVNGQQYDSSIGGRLYVWRLAVTHMIPAAPALGHGYQRFSASLDQLVQRGDVPADFDWILHAHNEFLHATVELGAVGCLLLLTFYLGLWRSFARLREPVIKLAGQALVLTALVFGLTDLITFNLITSSYFGCLSAFLLISGRSQGANEVSGPSSSGGS